MKIYLSAAIAHQAEKTQHDHRPDENGWCRFCLRHHRIRVRAGECTPYVRAQGFIDAYRRQQANRPRVAPGRSCARPD